ncbi:nicotinate phosphoribosyltransferase-like protein [Heterostelium album PN500]|uniref:nicotinate phosphoribosyltransferase n=1 Tax=Heterostelium pallidum (strain ATCC 26659 / Pp 5 / PN500) TaxID=670386 RepID=D3BMV1_HETP5|nr:nicotinate phosphoribosyltransferase-like protein [Heterostelium album PN500]EFA77313.1 nicotinate phosphoribosyltransferase-like protein [Heterostelium album PN500]|eukprot:XP_020429442.1 nicotinate phosphoribosyltransferase-like protein [Heterostelium album PN500]
MVYHSNFNTDAGYRSIGNYPILPLKTTHKGPAPKADPNSQDIIDEALELFKANILFRNFEVQGNGDRVLIYLTLYITKCLLKIATCNKADAEKQLFTMAQEQFTVPGDSAFPLGGMITIPSTRDATDGIRQSLTQLRLELGVRLVQRVYATDPARPNKWWIRINILVLFGGYMSNPSTPLKRKKTEEIIKNGNGDHPVATNAYRELKRVNTVNYAYQESNGHLKPLNGFVTPLLTDMYQITMAYSLWKNQRHNIHTVFDLYFRKNPFRGEFTVFAGLEEVIRFVSDFHFNDDEVEHIRSLIPDCDQGFIDYLKTLTSKDVTIYALKEGSVVFPRIPLIRIEGPLAVCQLFETTLLNLVNFASLVATNAARHKLAVGKDRVMLEFGLRRAQGPDGAMSASRYSYLGGADGTSNVLAHCFFSIPVKGTHAHSFVTSYNSVSDLVDKTLVGKDGKTYNLFDLALKYRKEMGWTITNESELVAFTAYARTFPNGFLALVDTYDTLNSGVPNYLCLALALNEIGYKAVGIRLDSGDLSYLSKESRKMFKTVGEKYNIDYFNKFQIVASNDLNESTIHDLNRQGHEIDVFAIGTNLVTCQAQPALGCVFKLVEIDGHPRIKLSQETNKVTLPGRKTAYRLFGEAGHPLVDLLLLTPTNASSSPDEIPKAGDKVLCLHPFEEQKRVIVTPKAVEELHIKVFDKGQVMTNPLPSLEEVRAFCLSEIQRIREDHLRASNPTPYKVSITKKLYDSLHSLWLESVPIREMK